MDIKNQDNVDSILTMIKSDNREDFIFAMTILRQYPLETKVEEVSKFLRTLYNLWNDNIGRYPGLINYIVETCSKHNLNIYGDFGPIKFK